MRVGPLLLPGLSNAKEVIGGEPFGEGPLKHQMAKDLAWRIPLEGGVVATLEWVMNFVIFQTVVKRKRPAVESQEGQPEPAPLGRPLGDFGVEATCCRTRVYARAGGVLPSRT